MFRSSQFRIAAILLFVASSIASAQTSSAKPTAPSGQKPQAPSSQPASPEAAGPVNIPSPTFAYPGGQLLNVRLDLTITDQRTNGTPASKTVSMLLSDRNGGRIRTAGDVKVGNNFRTVTLNVDATPEVLRDGRVRVACNVEYRAQLGQGNAEENQPTTVSEMFNVILADGKQTVVSQSADPASDRKVQVELKATIVK
jgi:hypothetical protein